MNEKSFVLNQNIDFPDDFDEVLYKKIGANVARVRKSRGITQIQLAHALGLKSQGLVSQAEIYYKKRKFNLSQLAKISVILEVNIIEFFK
jgi:transcriptional regulator with XRE-family HTH domain